MQGGYVQLTRSTDRTDLYLTVGPEPLGPDEERPHPSREAQAPEELLQRVLTRDGSKTLASDTPDLLDVRRLSTRELRAERDRLAELRAECPPDRSRELRLAARRAAEAEQARQQARTDHQAAAEQVAAHQGRLLRRRDLQAARDRLALAEHALRTTTGQADQAADRLGVLRRAQQRHLGWMEAHDADLRVQERSVLREDAWRRRVDQRALVLDPPGWLPAELGPVPSDRRSGRCGAPPPRSWTPTGAPTAWTTTGRRSMLAAGWPEPGGRLHRPHFPTNGPTGRASSGSAPAVASAPTGEATSGGRPWPTAGVGRTRAGCWVPSPAATARAAGATGTRPEPRWSTWPAGAATATTATTGSRTATDPAAPLAATSAARSATAASRRSSTCTGTTTPTRSRTRTRRT
jgi:hypothetical protein